jgi:hypothetical protein
MPRHTITTLSAAAAVAWLAGAAAGATYHVNGACGSDAWSGTSPDCSPPDGPKATIQAAINAASSGDEVLVWPDTYQERIDFLGKAVALRSQAGPQATIIDAQRTGTTAKCINGEGPDTVLEGFTITGGLAVLGGGMYNVGSSPTVRDCIFTNNEGEVGAGMRNQYGSNPLIEGCSFIDNVGNPVGAGMVNSDGQPVVRDCIFLHNTADSVGGVINLDPWEGPVTFVNCQFIQNESTAAYGALLDGSGALVVNCVFSRNIASATPGGQIGVLQTVHGEPLVINSTFSGNFGTGLANVDFAALTVLNSIIWGNSEGSIQGGASVAYSDVEGGWSGAGNIDADPLFVQPGTDNVRLSFGSPCINAGDNGSVPPDITTDIDGNPRISGGVVDMGAYEGEFEQEPAAAGDSDFDNGEFTILIPSGGELNPLEASGAIVVNTSGPDDATFVVEEHDDDMYPDAAGYSELACILSLDTSLEDGQYLATLFISFGEENRGGPAELVWVHLTRYDPVTGDWSLVVTGNTVASPGHDGPVGDRVVRLEGGDWGMTNEIGDYGVYWDPAQRRGFAWANVDVAYDFGLGMALCPEDCLQTPDGEVGIVDFLALLRRWGESSVGGPCDTNFDGVIDVVDFLALLDSWGVCPRAAKPATAGAAGGASFSLPPQAIVRSADIDGDGSVGRDDLAIMQSSWGPCDRNCGADLNTDDRVDARDFLVLLAAWR